MFSETIYYLQWPSTRINKEINWREIHFGVFRGGELIDHFILGGDETTLIAEADGDLRIVGEKGKKKHEKKVADYQGLITMYRTGIAAGHNGPTVFLLKGKKRKSGFNETF